MKKILALLLTVTLIGSLLVGCNSQPAGEEAIARPDTISTNTPGDTLIVAYAASPNGDFIEDFGNNAYDLSIKTLLHRFYGTFGFQADGEFALNTIVVKDYSTDVDDAGNKTYTFELHNDLKWSDGSPITASDYVGELLWRGSPAWLEAGAANPYYIDLLGYSDYNRGENEYFSGVALVDEFTFSVTIDAENLPFFYEVAFVSILPLSLATYAPGVGIITDANGSRFDRDISADAERIASTSGGERFAPTVVSGPYTFVSFENNNVTLRRNPHFKGDLNGNVPTLEWVVQTTVPEATELDMLLAGDIDLLPTMIDGPKIDRGRADANISSSSYLRNGFGNMPFIMDWGPTADVNVRWAIACLVDRTQLLDQFLGGYGGLVDSEYGASQWMYALKERELREALTPIAMNIDRANDYLDETAWVFEADGSTPFDTAKASADGSYLRHNADGEPLIIFHAAASAAVGEILEIDLMRNAPLAGMRYNIDFPDFSLLLDEYYEGFSWDDSERTYSVFSMAMNFSVPFDPYTSMHSDFLGTWMNSAGVNDAELDRAIMAMRLTEPGENETYANHWFDYVVRWNEILPMVPLYSNEYFNLFNSAVKAVNTTPFWDWYHVICEIEKWQ